MSAESQPVVLQASTRHTAVAKRGSSAVAANTPVATRLVTASWRAVATTTAIVCLTIFRGIAASQLILTNASPFDHLVVLNPAVSPKETYVTTPLPIGSDGVSRGFMFGELDETANAQSIVIHVPEHAPAVLLCVSIGSQDGRYRGKFQYTLPSQSRAVYRASLNSSYEETLKRYPPIQLAILATLQKGSCDSQPLLFLPSAWRPTVHPRLTMLLNSDGADANVYWPESSRTFECTDLPNRMLPAYKTRCTLDIPAGTGIVTLTIRRSKFNDRQPDTSFPAYIP
jgi:hypothetical protein